MRKFTKTEKLSLIFQFLTRYPQIKSSPYIGQHLTKAYQFNKIKKLLKTAYYHTPFYRRKYQASRIHPEDIKNWKDFKHLPTVTKSELIEHNLEFVDDRLDFDKLILSRSSGSTGKFVNIYFDAQAFITQEIQVVRMIKELYPRYSSLDKELLVYTSEYPFSSIGGFYRAIYIHNLLSPKQIFAKIQEVRPAIISIYPSILREIIEIYNADFRGLGVKTIITNSEHSTQSERDYFSNLLGCSVFDEFSSEELLSIAYQCPQKQYHVTQDCSYIELLSTNTDTEVQHEQLGEIVGTCLINFATPIIRYRQDDLAVFSTKPCSCGKTTPVLKTIAGRRNSSFKRQDGSEIPSGRILDWTYSLLLTLRLDIREYQIIQNTLTSIEIDLVVNDGYKSEFDDRKIISSFRQIFGHEFNLIIKLVPYIEKTKSGKHIPVRSLI